MGSLPTPISISLAQQPVISLIFQTLIAAFSLHCSIHMMELSSAQHQEMAADSLENMLICTKAQQERKPRPQQEQALKCPRCDSTNTKFCYYNNYSLTQPRYFCKSCRRYWTNGGTLRNVPVGGGCRKHKRPSSAKRAASSDTAHHQPQHQPHLLNSSSDHYPNPLSAFSSQMSSSDDYPNSDLSLVFARLQKQTSGFDYDHHSHTSAHEHNLSLLGSYSSNHFGNIMGFSNAGNISGHGFLEGLRTNLLDLHQTPNGAIAHSNNLYHGFGNNNNNSGISGEQIMIPYEDLSSHFGSKTVTLKQEAELHWLNDNRQVLWGAGGFPWHQINTNNGHEDKMTDNIDLIRENLSVFAAPVWHGLLNSPLM